MLYIAFVRLSAILFLSTPIKIAKALAARNSSGSAGSGLPSESAAPARLSQSRQGYRSIGPGDDSPECNRTGGSSGSPRRHLAADAGSLPRNPPTGRAAAAPGYRAREAK